MSLDTHLEFASRTPLWGGARTSFGSRCPGVEEDHTLKLGTRPSEQLAPTEAVTGDWSDALPLGGEAFSSGRANSRVAPSPGLSARVSSNPWPGHGRIEFQVPHRAQVRLQLFDAAGRLARNLFEGTVDAGDYSVAIDAHHRGQATLGAGVYFYRLESEKDIRTGKVVLLAPLGP